MKKRSSIFSEFFNRLAESNESSFAPVKQENYTNQVNAFKARLELQ